MALPLTSHPTPLAATCHSPAATIRTSHLTVHGRHILVTPRTPCLTVPCCPILHPPSHSPQAEHTDRPSHVCFQSLLFSVHSRLLQSRIENHFIPHCCHVSHTPAVTFRTCGTARRDSIRYQGWGVRCDTISADSDERVVLAGCTLAGGR